MDPALHAGGRCHLLAGRASAAARLLEHPRAPGTPSVICRSTPDAAVAIRCSRLSGHALLAPCGSPGWVGGSGPWLLAALSVAFLWPATGSSAWPGTPDLPAMFTRSAQRNVIGPRDTVLLLPVWDLRCGQVPVHA